MKIAILLTCHNRREKTIRCLKSVVDSHKTACSNIEFDIYITDDGSTDGTSEAVSALPFAEKIILLKGNGNLFWNAGMNNSWCEASVRSTYDGFLWLNDDSTIYPYFWVDLIETDNYCKVKYGKGGIYVGTTCDPATKEFTYGGFNYISVVTLKDEFVLPDGKKPKECQCGHGNITYVSRDVEQEMGHLYRKYHHGGGDHDYTYNAYKKGFHILVMPRYAGECENDHLNKKKVDFSKMGIIQRFKYLYSPFGFNFHNTLIFQRRNFPIRYPFVLVSGILKALFPSAYFRFYMTLRK